VTGQKSCVSTFISISDATGIRISGPLIGDPLAPDASHNDNIDKAFVPQAVSKEYFRRICPNPTIINTKDIVSASHNGDRNQNRPPYILEDGLSTMEVWIKKINAIEDPCLELDGNSASIFDLWYVERLHNFLSSKEERNLMIIKCNVIGSSSNPVSSPYGLHSIIYLLLPSFGFLHWLKLHLKPIRRYFFPFSLPPIFLLVLLQVYLHSSPVFSHLGL
jgi:hypothetical protein